MLLVGDGTLGLHFPEILVIAVPVLIILGVIAFFRGFRRGIRRD